jgi:hypothetical protein
MALPCLAVDLQKHSLLFPDDEFTKRVYCLGNCGGGDDKV